MNIPFFQTLMSFFLSLSGCPKCYKNRETVNPINQKTMGELYEDTVSKIKYLEAYGLEVEQLWECELREELEKNEEMKQHFEEHEIVDPLQPRDAFLRGTYQCRKVIPRVSGQSENQVSCIKTTNLFSTGTYDYKMLRMTNLLPLFTGMLILQVYTRGAINLRRQSLVILKLSLRILTTFLPTLD